MSTWQQVAAVLNKIRKSEMSDNQKLFQGLHVTHQADVLHQVY